MSAMKEKEFLELLHTLYDLLEEGKLEEAKEVVKNRIKNAEKKA